MTHCGRSLEYRLSEGQPLSKLVFGLGFLLYLFLLGGVIQDLVSLSDAGHAISANDILGGAIFMPGLIPLLFFGYFWLLRSDFRSIRFGIIGLFVWIPAHFFLTAMVAHGDLQDSILAIGAELAALIACIWYRRRTEQKLVEQSVD